MKVQAVNVYPFSSFKFTETEPKPEKDSSAVDRSARMREKFHKDGIRNTVGAVLLVHREGQPYLFLLQREGTAIYELPGGKLRDGEEDTDCLKRKLTSQLALPGDQPDWEISECVGMWWRPDYDGRFSPYLHDQIQEPKECKRIFVVQLFKGMHFGVPENYELFIAPFSAIHNNGRNWGQVISSIPVQLSRFVLNYPN